MNYAHLTDAELRAFLAVNPSDPVARNEAAERFRYVTHLNDMRCALDQAESIMALIESQVATVNACLEEIKDALQRATE